MTTFYDTAHAYFTAHPERLRNLGPWATAEESFCAALAYQFNGGVGPAYLNAADAARASGKLNPDWRVAPVGAFHYYALPGITAGHVSRDLKGGGKAEFMASTRFYGKLPGKWGNGIGAPTHEQYMAVTGATYLGWAKRYGANPWRGTGSDFGKTPAQLEKEAAAAAAKKAAAQAAKLWQDQLHLAAVYLRSLPRWKNDQGVTDMLKGNLTRAFVLTVQHEAKLEKLVYPRTGKTIRLSGIVGDFTRWVIAQFAAKVS